MHSLVGSKWLPPLLVTNYVILPTTYGLPRNSPSLDLLLYSGDGKQFDDVFDGNAAGRWL